MSALFMAEPSGHLSTPVWLRKTHRDLWPFSQSNTHTQTRREKKKKTSSPTDDGCSTRHESFDLWAFPPPSVWQSYFCDRKIFSKQAQVNNLSNNTMLPSKKSQINKQTWQCKCGKLLLLTKKSYKSRSHRYNWILLWSLQPLRICSSRESSMIVFNRKACTCVSTSRRPQKCCWTWEFHSCKDTLVKQQHARGKEKKKRKKLQIFRAKHFRRHPSPWVTGRPQTIFIPALASDVHVCFCCHWLSSSLISDGNQKFWLKMKTICELMKCTSWMLCSSLLSATSRQILSQRYDRSCQQEITAGLTCQNMKTQRQAKKKKKNTFL